MKKKSANTKRKKTKKISVNEKKTYALVAVGILSVCILLLTFSFFLLPLLEKQNKTTFDTESIAKEINAIEENSSAQSGKVQSTTTQNAQTEKAQTTTVQSANSKTSNRQTTTTKNETTQITNIQSEKVQSANTKTANTQTPNTKNEKVQTEKPKASNTQTTNTQATKVQSSNSGVLVFVFDDAGHNISQLEAFLSIPFPCTFAVLPGLSHTQEASKKIKASKHEMILHQPMQAINKSLNPGPGAITEELTPEEVKTILQNNLDEVGTSVGLNNHEGSLITSNYTLMKAVLEVVKKRNLIFLDSRTNAETVAPAVAKELGMQILERNIFLDNSKNVDDIKEQIKKGLEHAKKNGSVIMIGHVFTIELAKLLKELYPEFINQGFQFKTISEYAKQKFSN